MKSQNPQSSHFWTSTKSSNEGELQLRFVWAPQWLDMSFFAPPSVGFFMVWSGARSVSG
jgi:hypothetical protein